MRQIKKAFNYLIVKGFFDEMVVLSAFSSPSNMGRRYQGKTGGQVVIPMKRLVQEIWEKYRGVPSANSNGYFNKTIKQVAELAGIARFAEVTSHTMRRSFATNAYLARIPSIDIMKVTGHKGECVVIFYLSESSKPSIHVA